MTGQRAGSPVTTEVGYSAHDDLLTVSSPETMWHAGAALPAPALVSTPAPGQPAASCSLPPAPESVKAGRDFARGALLDWGMAAQADTAELVVSELVTNALRHGIPSARRPVGDRGVRLRLLAQDPLVMCMVSDPGSEIPVLRESALASESGRGLRVVEACSVRWGWHLLDEGGKIVWALLR
jgi:anti-sigma regulatory factor (Ser/Thr protein kinase)